MTRQQTERARVSRLYTKAADQVIAAANELGEHRLWLKQAAALRAAAEGMRSLAVEFVGREASAPRLHQTRLDVLMALLALNGHEPAVEKIVERVKTSMGSLRRNVTGQTATQPSETRAALNHETA